jgi:hypothetical protein
MVKRRHKPISDSEIATIAYQTLHMKVRSEQRLQISAYRAKFIP